MSYRPLTQLPAAPAGYDVVANSGWLGASKLYTALLATLDAKQAELAAAVMDELRERESARFAAVLNAAADKAEGSLFVVAAIHEGTTAQAA